MHVLVGIGILAALIGFAFGEAVARLFVGVVLALGAFVGLALGLAVFLDHIR